jgi:hypothetical protein
MLLSIAGRTVRSSTVARATSGLLRVGPSTNTALFQPCMRSTHGHQLHHQLFRSQKQQPLPISATSWQSSLATPSSILGGFQRAAAATRSQTARLAAVLRSRNLSSSSSSSGESGIVAWYTRQLTEKPIITKALTSAVIVLAGDLGCQLVIEGNGLDIARLARMFFLGGALVAPVLHVWYGALFR